MKCVREKKPILAQGAKRLTDLNQVLVNLRPNLNAGDAMLMAVGGILAKLAADAG